MSPNRNAETTLFTIGFTKKTAETFFSSLIHAGVRRVFDIRLNNVSQLAGFAKRDDLAYLLRAIGGIDYVHRSDLAPSREILDAYRKHGGSWEEFERRFRDLIVERKIETHFSRENLDHGCLLCSEPGPERCHRRLVAEYFQDKLGGLSICHL
jgi:uncharacterized protein (DUF488 family)